MTVCLVVSNGILLSLGITQNFSFDCGLPYTVNLVTAAIILIIFISCGFIYCYYYYIWGDV